MTRLFKLFQVDKTHEENKPHIKAWYNGHAFNHILLMKFIKYDYSILSICSMYIKKTKKRSS